MPGGIVLTYASLLVVLKIDIPTDIKINFLSNIRLIIFNSGSVLHLMVLNSVQVAFVKAVS